jgi:uncharacterized membrane protein (UPF0182 family)
LKFDGDPYAAIVDGRVKWIWDAYTTTDRYPYSQETNLAESTRSATVPQGTLQGTANYIRNSVKVVVDAFDGSMQYYVTDPSDPIIQVWENAFPDLFTPMAQAPASVVAHFRYPEDLFRVQTEKFADYHVTDPEVFYRKQDFWAIPADPTVTGVNTTTGQTTNPVQLAPYYTLMKLPGESEPTFSLIRPFTPQGRQNMVAWMAAKSDPSDYGHIINYQFPSGRNVDGPTQVFAQMNQDPQFSTDRTLFGQSGSGVLFGDFLVIPLGDALLYVEPVYIRSDQEHAIPELKRVLVVNGGKVGLGTDLQDAITNSLVGQVPTGGGSGGPTGSSSQKIEQLIHQALDHFDKANAALKAGDLATYQSELNAAQKLLQQADQIASRTPSTGGGAGGSTSPTTAPTSGASPPASSPSSTVASPTP